MDDIIQLRIEGSEEAPPEWAVTGLEQLVERFPELQRAVWAKVLERYRWHDLPSGCPQPQSIEEMGSLLILDDIHFSSVDELTLGYGLREGIGWDDLMFTVEIEGWEVTHCAAGD